MFNKLIASGPQRKRSWTPGAMTVSIVVHTILLTGAVYASVAAPKVVEKEEEQVTFVELEETTPEPPPPAPEPPPPVPQTVVPPPPQGFQELIPPIEPPAIIPLPDNSQPAINLADFSGLGVAGGTADGVEGGTPQSTAIDSTTMAYAVAVLDAPPKLTNLSQVQSTMRRLYPRMLLDAGISGTVTMQFVIQPDGTVDTSTLRIVSSSHERFADVSKEVAQRFRFQPGRYKGENVRVLIEMPVTWQVGS